MMDARLFLFALAACHHHEQETDAKREGTHVVLEAGTPAEGIIRAYESAASCDVRAQSIVRANANRRLLAAMSCGPHNIERLDTTACDEARVAGAHCIAYARRDGDKMAYYLVKQPDGTFLVDMRATELVTRLGEFEARPSTRPVIVRARVQSAFGYVGSFRGKTRDYAVVRLKALGGEPEASALYAYMPRTNADATRLEGIAAGAGSHELTLALVHVASESDTAIIAKLVSADLFETDAEDAVEAMDGGT